VASSPQSFNKRQREQAKREKAAAKRARRHARDDDDVDSTAEPADEDALLERFRVLNERRASGEITAEDFETEREEIFAMLGLGEA
jgi:hypothetical protein